MTALAFRKMKQITIGGIERRKVTLHRAVFLRQHSSYCVVYTKSCCWQTVGTFFNSSTCHHIVSGFRSELLDSHIMLFALTTKQQLQ